MYFLVNGVLTLAAVITLISSLKAQEKDQASRILLTRIKSLTILPLMFLPGPQTQSSMMFISKKVKEQLSCILLNLLYFPELKQEFLNFVKYKKVNQNCYFFNSLFWAL